MVPASQLKKNLKKIETLEERSCRVYLFLYKPDQSDHYIIFYIIIYSGHQTHTHTHRQTQVMPVMEEH